jgi:putative ubiquitin-RnfH superfamily antitoxin RatB of RatAB toxin-antitoxin module
VTDAPLEIEVAYAEPRRGIVKAYHLAAGATVADALSLAALDPDFAGVDLANSPVGIFGIPAEPHDVLREGDRIEIYRPLAADPKVTRRQRAQQSRKPPR